MPPTAFVRPVPDRYADATRGVLDGGRDPIDVARARAQHAAYVSGLRWLGYAIRTLPAAHALPDSVFVEDPAVISGRRALIARSAHPVRAREADAVRDALAEAGFEVAHMPPGATLDGGDVLQVGRRMWVSRSARTNRAGIDALGAAFPGVALSEVPLPPGVLHLKCACSRVGPRAVLVAEGALDPGIFAGLDVLVAPAEEAYAANAVGRAGRVLVAAGHPRTARRLARAGLAVRAVEVGEIRKGDGSLTCLSLRCEGLPGEG